MDRHARIRWLVNENTRFVARTLQKAGVPRDDLDDQIQRTFIVAARRIEDVQLGAERSFLFQVAINLASHVRRSLARCREVPGDQLPDPIETAPTPEEVMHQMQMRKLLDGILDRMDERLRAVFTLHEIEEMNLTEIAARLHLPRGTVASRLRRAREMLRKHAAAIELASSLGAALPNRIDQGASPWRKKLGALERALLGTGVSRPGWASTRSKTLAALGLA